MAVVNVVWPVTDPNALETWYFPAVLATSKMLYLIFSGNITPLFVATDASQLNDNWSIPATR